MTDLEHRVSLVWVVDSYWRTISTTHMGLSAGLVRGDRQSHGVLTDASAALVWVARGYANTQHLRFTFTSRCS